MAEKEGSLLARIKREDTEEDKKDEVEKSSEQPAESYDPTAKKYSLLSPNRAENKQVKEQLEDDYISPFSDEFIKETEKRDKEFEEEQSEDGAVSSTRLQAFGLLAFTLYLISLIVGYHNTPFSDNVPQVVTAAQLEGQKYLSQSNEYLNYIQNAHIETVEAVENYTAELMSSTELATLMKKNNEQLQKKIEDVEDMSAPSEYSSLQDGLKEMYNAQISMNAAAINYANNKSENTFAVVENTNQKYEDRSEEVLEMFDRAFEQ